MGSPPGRAGELDGTDASRTMRSWLLPGGRPLRALLQGNRILVDGEGLEACFHLQLESRDATIELLECNGDTASPRDERRDAACRALFTALECVFGQRDRAAESVRLTGDVLDDLAPDLAALGLLADRRERSIRDIDVFSYRPGWMPVDTKPAAREAEGAFPDSPLRPAKPSGTLYARHIPWLSCTLSFAAASMEDLPLLHRWLNDPLVDRFWREAGSIEKHHAYLRRQLDDPHAIPVMGLLNGVPFAYFEIYWAADSVIAPFYDADPFDRGWHVLVGEADYRGGPFIAAWLPSLMHLLFLDEHRTQRVVGEPDAEHSQQLRNLTRSGFEHFATVDLPTKQAALVELKRARFWTGRLWLPTGSGS